MRGENLVKTMKYAFAGLPFILSSRRSYLWKVFQELLVFTVVSLNI